MAFAGPMGNAFFGSWPGHARWAHGLGRRGSAWAHGPLAWGGGAQGPWALGLESRGPGTMGPCALGPLFILGPWSLHMRVLGPFI